MRIDRRFPADDGSVPAARRFAVAALPAVPPDIRDRVSLMVSELAMNVVQYARTDFTVTLELDDDSLRVEVADSGDGEPRLRPVPPARDPHGRGLFIVQRLSDEWGVAPSPKGTGKTVWFRVPCQRQAG